MSISIMMVGRIGPQGPQGPEGPQGPPGPGGGGGTDAHPGFINVPMETRALVDGVVIVASRLDDGYVYGVAGSTLYRSSDKAASWTAVCTVPGTTLLLIPAGDGEVLAACGPQGVH